MYLHHVTLTTGHVRRSPRAEVSADTLALMSPLVAAGWAEPIDIPGCDGYQLTGAVQSRCAVYTVWAGPEVPVCTIGIGGHSRCGATLWRQLHRGYEGLATDPDDCPPEPWVAARLEPGVALCPDATDWLGDFERCLGWAFLGGAARAADRRRRDRGQS